MFDVRADRRGRALADYFAVGAPQRAQHRQVVIALDVRFQNFGYDRDV